ncbi:hypothetical protein F2Q69_00021525 [Brassica cretica]|uniref:Uncharacterized protein n=1 Tax=Brassica cretica TaxID=69181 RepID=A0A8S9Q5C4_BRACR|nr:hypothetical protein F2Q69_00021525 [Brassica cretica]
MVSEPGAGSSGHAGESEGRALASHLQGAGKNMEHEVIRKSDIDALIKALKESGNPIEHTLCYSYSARVLSRTCDRLLDNLDSMNMGVEKHRTYAAKKPPGTNDKLLGAGSFGLAGESGGRAVAPHHQGAGKNMEHEVIRKSDIDALIKALKESSNTLGNTLEPSHIDHEGANGTDVDEHGGGNQDFVHHPDQSGIQDEEETGNGEHQEQGEVETNEEEAPEQVEQVPTLRRSTRLKRDASNWVNTRVYYNAQAVEHPSQAVPYKAVRAVPSVPSGSIHNSTKKGFTGVKEVNGQRGFTLGDVTVYMAKGTEPYPYRLGQTVKAKGALSKMPKTCDSFHWINFELNQPYP